MRFSRVSNPAAVAVLALTDTILLASSYVGASFWALRDTDAWFYFRYENGWLQLALLMLLVQSSLYLMNLYGDLRGFSRTQFVQQLCIVLGIAFLVQALIGYTDWVALQLPQWTMFYGSLLVLLLLPAWRIVFFALVKDALPGKRVLVLGSSTSTREIVSAIQRQPHMGYRLVAHLERMEDFADAHPPSGLDLIVVAHRERTSLPIEGLLDARLYGVQIEDAAAFYETLFGRVSFEELDAFELLTMEPATPAWVRVQTGYSVVLAALALPLVLPLILGIAILVKLSSPGPVFVGQRRAGMHGVPFTLYEFRLPRMAEQARSTRWEYWLWRLRLDRLPRLWNVLRGDMALVGPHPERLEFAGILDEALLFHYQRHCVKPGLTGWAMINCDPGERAAADTELAFDLFYMKHLAPALDAYILLHSVKNLLAGRSTA